MHLIVWLERFQDLQSAAFVDYKKLIPESPELKHWARGFNGKTYPLKLLVRQGVA